MPQSKTSSRASKRVTAKKSSAGSARKTAAKTGTGPSTRAFERGSGNVFADMGAANADERLAKAELARIVRGIIRGRIEHEGWTQARAAGALGIAPGDMSNLLRGKLAGFSQERLGHFLTRLDMEVRIQVAPRPPGKVRAGILVEHLKAFC